VDPHPRARGVEGVRLRLPPDLARGQRARCSGLHILGSRHRRGRQPRHCFPGTGLRQLTGVDDPQPDHSRIGLPMRPHIVGPHWGPQDGPRGAETSEDTGSPRRHPVAQWIDQRFPEPRALVRFRPGVSELSRGSGSGLGGSGVRTTGSVTGEASRRDSIGTALTRYANQAPWGDGRSICMKGAPRGARDCSSEYVSRIEVYPDDASPGTA
jgi:hypothetical protein